MSSKLPPRLYAQLENLPASDRQERAKILADSYRFSLNHIDPTKWIEAQEKHYQVLIIELDYIATDGVLR